MLAMRSFNGDDQRVSLNHVIVIAIVAGAVAVAAPQVAPGLLSLAVEPPVQAVDDAPPAQPTAPPPQRIVVVRDVDEPSGPIQTSGRRVALRADQRGHYQVDATVNGRSIEAIVDTGATTVALNADSARRVGIYLSRSDYTVPISTANGVVAAAPVMLSQVRVGGIVVRNVQAVVLPGNVLTTNLLGMSFLARLSKFEVANGQLVLTQ